MTISIFKKKLTIKNKSKKLTLIAGSGIIFLVAKASTNDKIYKANGITQKSGVEPISVVTKLVNPSIKEEGTKARNSHVPISLSDGCGLSSTWIIFEAIFLGRLSPHIRINTARSPKPI